MSNTDFIDDDLIQRRDAVKEVKIGPARDALAGAEIPKSEPVPVQELNLTPLTQRKEELNSQMASKLDELERLRARQEALEREKNSLEQLRVNQEKYEAGKREMIDHLEQSLVVLEREEILLHQRLDLLNDTEKRFKDMLAELRRFQEDQWPADSEGFRNELTKALAVVDNTRKEYNKALARIDALKESQDASAPQPALRFNQPGGDARASRGFTDWLKIGLAVSLPVIILLAVLIAVLILKTPGY